MAVGTAADGAGEKEDSCMVQRAVVGSRTDCCTLFFHCTVHSVGYRRLIICLTSGIVSGHIFRGLDRSCWLLGENATYFCLILDKRLARYDVVISRPHSIVATCIYVSRILWSSVVNNPWCRLRCRRASQEFHISFVARASVLVLFIVFRPSARWLRWFLGIVHHIRLYLFLLLPALLRWHFLVNRNVLIDKWIDTSDY